MKRFADILTALTGLILTLPLQIFCAWMILIFDQQNPVFLQTRLGKQKKHFTIFKLRTMKNDKVTWLGKFLRKTGLDELPQLWNILIGQMSFVGPRPLTDTDVERLGWNDEFHRMRWKLKPGLTGLAQLSPVCHKKMSWFLDKKYVLCHPIMLDLRIIFSSISVILVGKKNAVKWMYKSRYERTR